MVKEDQLYYWKINYIIGRSTLLLEDKLCCWRRSTVLKTVYLNYGNGRSAVLLEDHLHYWKINGAAGYQLYWRQSTRMDCNYLLRTTRARRWLYKYGAECSASSFTWYLYQMCITDVRPSHLFHYIPIILSSWNFQELLPWPKVISMQKVKVKGQGHKGHDPTWPFPDSNSSLNSQMATKFCTQLEPT